MEWELNNLPNDIGYYLVVWKVSNRNVFGDELLVSELWFNPSGTPPWWYTNRYTGHHSNLGNPFLGKVLAWMPMPDPPKGLIE